MTPLNGARFPRPAEREASETMQMVASLSEPPRDADRPAPTASDAHPDEPLRSSDTSLSAMPVADSVVPQPDNRLMGSPSPPAMAAPWSTDGHVDVDITDADKMSALIACLINDSSIRSLALTSSTTRRTWISNDTCDGALQGHAHAHAPQAAPVDWLSLRSVFQACSRLRVLDIHRCEFTYADWVALVDGFEGNRSIQHLIVGGKGLFDLTVVNMLSALMGQLGSLRSIEIKEAELSFFCVHRLMANAHACHGLVSLRFENIRCPDSTLKLSQLLQTPHDAQTTLSHIAIVGYPLADLYEEHERLSVLLAISHAHCLRSLDLTHCELSAREIEALAEIVEHSPSLEALTLTGNAVNESAQRWIEETLERNRQIHMNERLALENRAAVTYDLILRSAPAVPPPWPPELSGVLAENSPKDLLEMLARGIDSHH